MIFQTSWEEIRLINLGENKLSFIFYKMIILLLFIIVNRWIFRFLKVNKWKCRFIKPWVGNCSLAFCMSEKLRLCNLIVSFK